MFKTRLYALVAVLALLPAAAFPQAETAPADHPVYSFLKRMEVKGLISRYHDAVLPLSRREVAAFLVESESHSAGLSTTEHERLQDFLSEFQFDIRRSVAGFSTTAGAGGDLADSLSDRFWEQRERYLFLEADSSVSLFTNLLLDGDARGISGDALGSVNATYLQLGLRARGTLLDHLGYSVTATNAAFWGSRDLLNRDPLISQSHALRVSDIQNFDFEEGSVRYDAGMIGLQVGRERVLWGSGYEQKMVFSDNPRVFDFIRGDVSYKALRYTFMHAWLLGTESNLLFTFANDSSTVHDEPVISDKYVAAHRLELSFPGVIDVGAQEIVVYSNRSFDLGYLTPISLFESVQRSRGERDNVFWCADVQLHFIKNIELTGTLFYDDIMVPDMFTNKWRDRYAWQVGMFYADPFTISNVNLVVEYTRVEPYVFSHGRSRDDSYTSLGAMLGTNVGPNGDSWVVRTEYLPVRNLVLSMRVIKGRHGMNILDKDGRVLVNVGGDVLFPHRDGVDSDTKEFLSGIRYDQMKLDFSAQWEIINQCWVEARYQYNRVENKSTSAIAKNSFYGMHIRLEL
jgi:hypothetical protein